MFKKIIVGLLFGFVLCSGSYADVITSYNDLSQNLTVKEALNKNILYMKLRLFDKEFDKARQDLRATCNKLHAKDKQSCTAALEVLEGENIYRQDLINSYTSVTHINNDIIRHLYNLTNYPKINLYMYE